MVLSLSCMRITFNVLVHVSAASLTAATMEGMSRWLGRKFHQPSVCVA